MTSEAATAWDGVAVRKWLEARVAAARSDQAVAERGGYGRQDDCDKATAEEMVCSLLNSPASTGSADALLSALRALLERDDYVWRGVYDDRKFDRHVRSFIKKLVKMAKANDGFGNLAHYQ